MIKIIVVFDIITSKEIIYVIDIFDIHDILDMIDPIEIIIICISDNIYIIDTIYSLDIIETSIDIIADEEINDDVNNVNDCDHIYQTRQFTELINGSYDRGRFQEQYLFWLLVTKMASGSLITIFVNESSISATLVTSGDKTKQLRKLVKGPGGRYLCLLQYLFWLLVPKTASGSLKAVF